MSNPTKGPQLQVLILPILTLLMLAGPARGFSGPDIGDLRVEYLREPIGIDVDKPHFSWKMTAADGRRGLVQEAYRIVVSDEQDNRVWDSGKVGSGLALGIAYQGKPLNPGTRYAWNLTVWDREGQPYTGSSWFETGLMDPNPNAAAWGGAQWIGTTQEDLPLCAQYLSMFRLQYGLALDQVSGSTRAAFVFGANDRRLLDKNRNLLGMQNKKDQGYMALELDISGLGAGKDGKARLNIYRVGYAPGDRADQPFKSYEIPTTLVNDGNKYDRHQFYVECNFGVFNIYMDGSEEANKITRSGAQDSPFVLSGLMLNPYGDGPGGDYLSFPMLADIGFMADQGQTARFSDIRVRHYRRPSNVIFSESTAPGETYAGIFRPFLDKRDGKFAVAEGAYVVSGAGDGVFAVADPGRNAAPMLRTEFETADKAVKKARLYVTARGIYEVYLNGRRVGNDYFNPGLKDQTVKIGMPIRVPIPNAAIKRYMESGFRPNENVPVFYIVKKGDTLFRIAKVYFRMPIELVMARNNLADYSLKEGQQLHVGWISVFGVPDSLRQHAGGPLARRNAALRKIYQYESVNKRQYDSQGVAVWQKESKEDSDLYGLHSYAPKNSIIEVLNPMNNRTVYVKVIGKIPLTAYRDEVTVILSPLAAKLLGAIDPRFFVKIKYYR